MRPNLQQGMTHQQFLSRKEIRLSDQALSQMCQPCIHSFISHRACTCIDILLPQIILFFFLFAMPDSCSRRNNSNIVNYAGKIDDMNISGKEGEDDEKFANIDNRIK